jgi:hypothetical protein
VAGNWGQIDNVGEWGFLDCHDDNVCGNCCCARLFVAAYALANVCGSLLPQSRMLMSRPRPGPASCPRKPYVHAPYMQCLLVAMPALD